MALGTQLGQLVTAFKAEAGHSTLVSAGVDYLPAIHQLLRRTQRTLYQKFDWPHLTVMPFKTLSAGSRYYDMPAGLEFERIVEVNVWYSGLPQPIDRGISFAEYSAYDSDSDSRADPVLRWDLRWTGTATQIEVWPIPASNGSRLQFRGLRPLRPLVDDADVADLDDDLIVLYAAAEILLRQESKDAQAKMAAARDHFDTIKANYKGGSKPFVLGGGAQPRRPGKAVVQISGGA